MNSYEKKELEKLQENAKSVAMLSDKEKSEILVNFAKQLSENQQDLPPEISKIVDECLFDLI